MLACLVGFLGDFDLAEEAAQEAFAIAAERWARDGVPANPGAWLVSTARNRAIDRLRRARVLAEKTANLETPEPLAEQDMDETSIPDERLELLFTCCHPALSTEAQVALTLYALGGLSTAQIARAFLVSPETMKRRLTRAKAKITVAGIPFSLPPEHLLPERVAAALAVIYLIFNAGYSLAPTDAWPAPEADTELAPEAIRLGRVLAMLMPDESEVHGLLALMLLHDARRHARFAGGELAPSRRVASRPWRSSIGRRSPTTSTRARPAPSSCAGSVAAPRRATPTGARSSSPTPTASAASCSGAWRSSDGRPAAHARAPQLTARRQSLVSPGPPALASRPR